MDKCMWPMFREALSIKCLGLGPDHPSIGVSLNNIGRAQAKQGRLAEAEATYRRCGLGVEGGKPA